MREMAAALNCDPSSVTFLVDRLAERGLIERVLDPRDRRVKRLGLTAEGHRARCTLVASMVAGSPFTELPSRSKQSLLALLTRALQN